MKISNAARVFTLLLKIRNKTADQVKNYLKYRSGLFLNTLVVFF